MSSSPVSIVYGNLKGNVGDFAILDAMIRCLAQLYPDKQIEVFDQARLTVDHERFRVHCDRLEVPFSYRGPLPKVTLASEKSEWLTRHFRWHQRQQQARQIQQAAVAIDSAVAEKGLCNQEAVFFPGGAQWSGGELAVNMFGLLQALARRGVPTFTFPFSIHPSALKNNHAADLRSYFAQFSGPILVRDSRSKDTLRSAGIESLLMPDVAFSLPSACRTAPNGRTRPQVGLSIAECRGTERESLRKSIRNLCDAGIDPVLVTTCVPEDGEFIFRLAASLGLPLIQPLGWQDAVERLQAFDLFISNRLHGVIFAHLGNTPVIPMINRDKVAGVAADAKLSRTVARVDQITPQSVLHWIGEADQIQTEMAHYLDRSQARWCSFSAGMQSPMSQCAA